MKQVCAAFKSFPSMSVLLSMSRHALSLILFLCITLGITFTSGMACGIGSSLKTTGDGDGTGGGPTGPIQDLGSIFNDELPGTNVQAGETSQFVTITALGRSMIVLDTVTEEETVSVENNLKFNTNQQGGE